MSSKDDLFQITCRAFSAIAIQRKQSYCEFLLVALFLRSECKLLRKLHHTDRANLEFHREKIVSNLYFQIRVSLKDQESSGLCSCREYGVGRLPYFYVIPKILRYPSATFLNKHKQLLCVYLLD